MANYTGISGPAPKRKDETLGHARKSKDATDPVDSVEFAGELRALAEKPEWLDVAKYAYRAYLESPLNQFYTETDIAFGWMVADAIHRAATDGAAMKISAAESLMRAAMFNEADRRRVRVEVTRKAPPENPTAQRNKDELAARRKARDAE